MAKPFITNAVIAGITTGSPVIAGATAGTAAPAEEITEDQVIQATQALSRFPHTRLANSIGGDRNAQIMHWRLPNGSSVQMYINPENFQIRESKQITQTRTKGGFVIQYWGENLTQLTLSGTTGSSGVRGVQVLRDIYRAENRGFDLVAAQQLQLIQRVQNNISITADVNSILQDTAREIEEKQFLLRPSLASLATSVILFYQGIQYKGFFTEMTTTESINKLGLFDYSLTFMATETRGQRKNFLAWHKEPLADDPAGQILTGIGNTIRGLFGLQSQGPVEFHPENAPYTFGGNSLANALGFTGANSEVPSVTF